MNGPESFGKGDLMAKGKKVAPQPRWTKEEIEKGEEILLGIKTTVDTTNITDQHAQASIAARNIGQLGSNQTFKNLPPAIKSYLEFVWRMESPDERIKRNLAQMKEDFQMQMENPDFRHAKTHPEDELLA